MAHIEGRKCFLSFGGTLLEGIMSSNFDLEVAFVEGTTNDSDGHEEGVGGDDSATGTVEGRVSKAHTYGVTQLLTATLAKVAVALIWGPGIDVMGERILSCNVILTNCNSSAEHSSTFMPYSVTWRKTGAVSEATSATTLT